MNGGTETLLSRRQVVEDRRERKTRGRKKKKIVILCDCLGCSILTDGWGGTWYSLSWEGWIQIVRHSGRGLEYKILLGTRDISDKHKIIVKNNIVKT